MNRVYRIYFISSSWYIIDLPEENEISLQNNKKRPQENSSVTFFRTLVKSFIVSKVVFSEYCMKSQRGSMSLQRVLWPGKLQQMLPNHNR